MVRSLITSAVKTTAAGGVGSALLGGSGAAGTLGTVATVVAAPWFLPACIVSGILVGGVTAYIKSINEIIDVNSNFD